MKNFVRLFVVLGLLVQTWTTPFALAAKQPVYYVVPHSGPGDPFWSVMFRGVEETAKKLGVRVVFSAPDQPGDVAKQVALVRAAIAANPSGIALTIPDRKAFARIIQEARAKKIPVVAFDTREDPRNTKELPYQAYMGADEYQSGKRVGEKALEMLPPGSKVVVATHMPGHMGLELRLKGISDVLTKKNIVVEKLDITSNTTKGIAVLSSYFKRSPDIKGIFTLGPLGATAAGKYFSENPPKQDIVFSSFDLDEVTMRYIKSGLIDFTLDQMPYMQAYMIVSQLYLASEFALTPVDVDTGGGFVTKDNIAQVEDLVKKGYR